MRTPDGDLVPRSLAQLSGGERRRIALALCLGFADLLRSRARLTCNLLVLDEVRGAEHAFARVHTHASTCMHACSFTLTCPHARTHTRMHARTLHKD